MDGGIKINEQQTGMDDEGIRTKTRRRKCLERERERVRGDGVERGTGLLGRGQREGRELVAITGNKGNAITRQRRSCETGQGDTGRLGIGRESQRRQGEAREAG